MSSNPPITRLQAKRNYEAARAELDRATEDATNNHGGAETDWYLRANEAVAAAEKQLPPGLRFLLR